MGEKRNFAALDWVVDEIGDTLKDARQALESYVEDPKDSTRIRFCLTHIHQVHGSLQMVEFHGASLLAEEMEQLAQALMNNAVSSDSEAHEVLMRSLLQLPLYLEHVKVSRDDHPGIVLPLLNDLRAVRKQSYLTETNLFSPDLSVIRNHTGPKHAVADSPEKLTQVLRKLREMYQFAAASVLRGINIEENLTYLDKVFSRLQLLTQGTASYPTWEVASALVDGLVRDDVELSVAVRGLLRHLAKELRILAEKAPASLDDAPREALLKNLLYYVSGAAAGSDKVAQVKERYKLNSALLDGSSAQIVPESEGLSAPDPEAVRSVVIALSDELYSIKHVLDGVLTKKSTEELPEILPVVKRVADTLAVLGIGDLRKQVLAQSDQLELMIKTGDCEEESLMEMAGKFVEIEHRLEAISRVVGKSRDLENLDEREIEIDQAKATVIRECQNGLEQAKDAIVEYISSQWDRSHLSHVGGLLTDIRGGLDMIPLPRAAKILTTCDSYIQEELLSKDEHPTWTSMDSLADAISSVEYYLEQLANDFEDEAESFLEVAEQSLETLGYKVVKPLQNDRAKSVVAEPRVENTDAAELPPTVKIEQVAPPELPIPEVTSEEQASALTENEITVEEVSEAVDEVEPLPVPELDVLEEPAEEDTEEEEDDIDEEIIEIFIEEAGEVLETLAEYFPKWRKSLSDEESLAVVRRSFHTLKGSGRMVNANDIGELAWSVENMLNRIIDQTIEATDTHLAFIDKVLTLLPKMVKAFKNSESNPEAALAEQYMAWGKAMSEGQMPDFDMVGQANASNESRQQAQSQSASDVEDDDESQLLREIFSSEAKTHMATIRSFIHAQEIEAPIYTPPTNELQRALHTLKGSAKMAQITPIGVLSESLEMFVKELVTYQVRLNFDILQLIKDGVDYVGGGIEQIDQRTEVDIPRLQQFLARTKELRELAVGHLIHQKELEKDGLKTVDPRLLSIFMAEEMELLLDADVLLKHWLESDGEKEKLSELIEELAALGEGAKQANLPSMEELSGCLNVLHTQLLDGTQVFDGDYYAIAKDGHDALLDMVDSVAAGQLLSPASDNVIAALRSLHERAAEPEQDIEDVFAQPSEELAETKDSGSASLPGDEDLELSIVDEDEPQIEERNSLQQDGYEVVDDDTELEIEVHDEPELEASTEGEAFEDDEQVIEADANADFEIEIESELPEGFVLEEDESSNAIHNDIVTGLDFSAEELVEDVVEETTGTSDDDLGDEPEKNIEHIEDSSDELTPENQVTVGSIVGLLDTIDTAHEDYDEDILEVFLEEADELSEELDEAIHSWESDWADLAAVDEIKRCLHTLKGGARLAGMPNFGQLTHEYESFLITSELSSIDEPFFAEVHAYQDKVLKAVKAIRQFRDGGSDIAEAQDTAPEQENATTENGVETDTDSEVVSAVTESNLDQHKTDEQDDKGRSDNVLPFAPKPKELTPVATPAAQGSDGGFSMPQVAGGGQPQQASVMKKAAPQEVVKVSADLLEELVNLAGETSITRGRLETQVSDFNFSLDEMDATLSRLQEQLRRLDIETEAQVLFRQEQLAAHEDFDPLEMDRYSQLQQLSRSLTESASDLIDLKSTLDDKVRDTETVLLQQSRINTTLQEGLMRSRMVPFSRLVPRLRRIVRQVASELGKNVSFELDNVEGELDRSVLERMVPPLEHMLRNAVDHGIEMPETRIDSGKSEAGRIVLTLGREGGDVILRLADDGQGINLARVREKAIERGLMAENAKLSNHDIIQFILHAGFSTADSVTQISGRGVGMDVVNSEIKQLGGSVTINSEFGKGTEFIVRLPFTVSVNRALMVTLGSDSYAVPLNSIEGIVRVSPFELEHYYNDPSARFEYAGENYQVRYLGSLLGSNTRPKLEGQALPLPVLLVRSAEHTMALQVDSLQGSREIVVKSLGQQFSAVQGLSGATVMGDGSVVVILDTHALVRDEIARAAPQLPDLQSEAARAAEAEKISTVMVVDDSVTVRKVTSRFLERNGFNVTTAKDGVDALQALQEDIPDLMLLDIEMPRMDGFEVAKNVRTTRRWKNIPIIMITSRTGDKHRDHALSLGVDNYMGKPYQEDVLLESINDLLAKSKKAK